MVLSAWLLHSAVEILNVNWIELQKGHDIFIRSYHFSYVSLSQKEPTTNFFRVKEWRLGAFHDPLGMDVCPHKNHFLLFPSPTAFQGAIRGLSKSMLYYLRWNARNSFESSPNSLGAKSASFFRHFEKNSRTKKLKTQEKNSITQGKNSRFG